MSYCVIAVNQYGDIMTRDTLNIEDKYLINLDFRGNGMAYDDDSNLEYVDDDPAPFVPLMFEVIQPGSYMDVFNN